jgi:hypothetical protein
LSKINQSYFYVKMSQTVIGVPVVETNAELRIEVGNQATQVEQDDLFDNEDVDSLNPEAYFESTSSVHSYNQCNSCVVGLLALIISASAVTLLLALFLNSGVETEEEKPIPGGIVILAVFALCCSCLGCVIKSSKAKKSPIAQTRRNHFVTNTSSE